MNRISRFGPNPTLDLIDGLAPFALAPNYPAVGGPTVASTEGNRPAEAGTIPWRRATTPRTSISESTTRTMTTSSQNVEVPVDGTGYITAIALEVVCTTAANAAATAYQADGPYSVLDIVSLRDSGGELISLTGYELFIANLYFGPTGYGSLFSSSADTNIYSLTSGAGATGGSFRFHLILPIAINSRNFLGLLGNQDRAQKYSLRTDIGASTNVYSTSPTTLGSVVINRTYVNTTVPAPVNQRKIPQQIYPPKFGVQHFLTRQTVSNPPVGGSTINHQLPRIGNTVRGIALIFRSNGSRATAESNLPTRIVFKLGDTPIHSESVQYRRMEMYRRYGFDAPAGVIVYDKMADILDMAGDELGLDWLWTAGIAFMQLEITYPSGFGSTNNSLVVITDDIIVPEGLDVYAPEGV